MAFVKGVLSCGMTSNSSAEVEQERLWRLAKILKADEEWKWQNVMRLLRCVLLH
jgi:hypothetical protein